MNTPPPTPPLASPPISRLRADMSLREVVSFADAPWVPSPAPGVDRRMLDRVGDEVARATTVVRYAANSSFDAHEHELGEEFLVLEGVFSDEHGDYPAGTYVRNPPGSRHAPRTKNGCTIFVKLRQFATSDLQRVVVDTNAASFGPGPVEGLTVLPLHEHEGVSTALMRWAPTTRFPANQELGGEEIVVLEGTLSDEHGDYPHGTWIRSPHLSQHHRYSEDGCLIYMKVGHLPH